MTDIDTKKLREHAYAINCGPLRDAADHIDRLAADLVKARVALRQIADEPLADCYNDNYAFDAMQTARDIASRTLAEIEKEARS